MNLYIFGCGGGALHILEDGLWFDKTGREYDFDSSEIIFVADDEYVKSDSVKIYGKDYPLIGYSRFDPKIIYGYPVSCGHISSFNPQYKRKIARNTDEITWLNSFSHNYKRFKYICIGVGTRISSYCHIDSDVLIGNHVKINSLTMIGHDCVIGEYSYISQQVVLDNHVTVGEGCYIFEHSTLLPGVCIGNNTTIGAGSVVTKDIPSGVIAYGNPCKVIRPSNAGIMDGAAVSEND